MNEQQQTKRIIAELTTKLERLETENVRLKETQQQLAEVNNNYLMLHYLTNNIQACRTAQELWETYLHNLSDCGFNYDHVAVLLSDEKNDFTEQLTLAAGKVVQTTLRQTANYILQAINTKTSVTSPDNLKAALPIAGKSGRITAILLTEKASGIFFEDLQLLDVYIRQTAAIIDNIMLNEKLRHFQELLGRQLDQFVMLHYVTKAIHDAGNYYDVLEKYLTTLCTPLGFGFREGILYILAENKLQRASLQQDQLTLVEMEAAAGQFLERVVNTRQYSLSQEERHLLMPLNSFGNVTAVIEINHDRQITAEQIQILEIFAMQTSSAIDNTRLKLHLEYVSFHDQLTGLYNRAYFEREIQRLEKAPMQPVGLIICDLDGLKMINDTCGHTAGDYFIAAAADLIKSIVPSDAVTARIGGDEFAVLISGSAAQTTEQTGLLLKQELKNYNARSPAIPLGMSVGWATRTKLVKMIDVFKQADSRMYQDKYLHGEASRKDILNTITNCPRVTL